MIRAVLASRPPRQVAEYNNTNMNSILPVSSFCEVVESLVLELEDSKSQDREEITSDEKFDDVITS